MIKLTDQQVQFAKHVGIGRKEQNRLRREATNDKSNWSEDPGEDIQGALGEVVVHVLMDQQLDYNKFVVPWQQYSLNKNKDILDYEIKTIDKPHYNFVIPVRQVKDDNQIYLLVYYDNQSNSGSVVGQISGEKIKVVGEKRRGISGRPDYYYVDKKHLDNFNPERENIDENRF